MSPSEIDLVRDSFRKVLPIADQAAALFYARLFELDSTLRPLFRGDMDEQGRRVITAIGAAVAALDRFDSVVPMLRQLGVRHASYGVTEGHYATVGAALLWTLQRTLGAEFTPAVKEAWTSTYTMIATAMIEAARDASKAA